MIRLSAVEVGNGNAVSTVDSCPPDVGSVDVEVPFSRELVKEKQRSSSVRTFIIQIVCE